MLEDAGIGDVGGVDEKPGTIGLKVGLFWHCGCSLGDIAYVNSTIRSSEKFPRKNAAKLRLHAGAAFLNVAPCVSDIPPVAGCRHDWFRVPRDWNGGFG